MGEKVKVDWERVEASFRVGLLSLREIATAHGITEGAVRKRAKRDGWVRDLTAKVHARAEDLVRKEAVRSQVRIEGGLTESVLVEASAQVVAQIRGQHRVDIGRSRALVMTLFAELEAQTGNLPGLVDLGEMLRAPNENGADRLNDVYQAVISLPERTKTVKALSESLKNLIGLEREAYGIAAAAQELNVTVKRAAKEMTDDELAAIAAGGSAGNSHPA